MKRFVSYIYQYDRGNRGKNVGFAKTDIRDNGCRVDLHIRGLERCQEKAPIYFIVSDDELIGIPAGEMIINQGVGAQKLVFPRGILADAAYTMRQVQAVVIRCSDGRLLVSSWTDAPSEKILTGDFRIWSKSTEEEKPPTEPEILPEKETLSADLHQSEAAPPENASQPRQNPQPNTDLLTQTASPASPEDNTANAFLQKIELADIRKLPKRNWHLCNNNFLVHGFFNYHHLVLKTVECDGQKKSYLGVPGIYETPERMMALLFGFPEFEPAPNDAGEEQNFGYWMCLLED